MTDVLARPKSTTSAKPRAKDAVEKKPPLRVLAVLDGSESTGRVTKYLLDLHARHEAIDVVLLNVQPKPEDGRLRGYGSFRRTEIEDRLINDLGRRIMTGASRHLQAAGIEHRDRIELGNAADVIIRCATEENCELIVMAEPQPEGLRLWLMNAGIAIGSVASVVIHTAPAPVLIAR